MSDVEEHIAAVAPPVALTADLARARMRAGLFGPTVAPSSERYTILERLGAGGMGTVWAAWDRKLDRKVALKLLHPGAFGDAAAGHALLLREAQALARVSDPHVVAVFDVTTWSPPDAPGREHVLLAMEFIAGESLATWLQRPRSLPEIVEKFVGAARGLLAAHRAGVVHGDVKPGNVIVDREGRAKLVDFGLARVAADPRPTAVGEGIAIDRATAAPTLADGRVAGTPQYMAPEQHEGRRIDAQADQYALCVSIWEATSGQPPFVGATMAEFHAAKLAFDPRRVPPGMPRWLHRVLARGLAPAPEARHASVEAVVSALQRGIAPRWPMPAMLAAVALATGTVVLARDTDPCDGGASRVAEHWDPARSQAMATAFADTGLPWADPSWRSAAQGIDDWTSQWQASWRDACENHRAGRNSDALFDLRAACLERRFAHLEALLDAFAEPTPEIIENAVQMTSRLPSVGACDDTDRLREVVPLPEDPAQRAEIEALARRVASARVALDAGHYATAAATATQIEDVARAQPEVHAPIVADAISVRADAQSWLGQTDEARGAWRASALLATQGHDDETFVRSVAGLVWELGNAGGDPALAWDWAALGEATLARGRAMPHATYLLLNATGTLAMGQLDFERARTDLHRALALVEQTWGADDFRGLVLHSNLGNVEIAADRPDAAILELQAAVHIGESALGPAHPRVAMSRYNLAIALIQTGDSDRSVEVLERLLVDQTAIFGATHPQLGWTYATLAMAETNLAYAKSARTHADQALARLGDDASNRYARVVARLARARAELALGETPLAEADARAAIEELDAGPHTGRDASEALAIVSEIALANPQGRDSQPEFAAAWRAGIAAHSSRDAGVALRRLAEFERGRGRAELALWWITASLFALAGESKQPHELAQSHAVMTEVLLDLGRTDAAATQLDRAWALLDAVPERIAWRTPIVLVAARLATARGDLAAARALVVAQRDRLDPASSDRGRLDAWLAAHP